MSRRTIPYCWILFALLPLAGCDRKVAAPPPPPLQKVKFVMPREEVVREYEEFPGRTGAVEIIDVRSRVTGYLDQIRFTDGASVKKGDLLFVIDPRTYEAEEARTKATIDQFQARVNRLQRQRTRSQELFEKQAISQDEYETILYDESEAQASLKATIAAHDLAKLNVEFTQIRAPIGGRMSRRLVDIGNLVLANDTPLATVIPLDEVYVYFDMDERTVLRLRRLAQQSTRSTAQSSPAPRNTVDIALADSDVFDLQGKLDFEDNQIDASTGTLRVRALVKNPSGLLSPGMFVRVRYPIGQPGNQLLIPEESLGSDQGRPFVYVIGEGDKVAFRPVETGPQVGTQRVIREGLRAGERVVITGLQRIRRDARVLPEPLSEKPAAAKVVETKEPRNSADTGPKTKDSSAE